MSNIFTRILKKVQAVNPKQVIVTERVFRTVSTRKLRRQALKNQQGNNNIHGAWQKQQVQARPSLAKLYARANKWHGKYRQRVLNQISRRCSG